MTHMERFQAAKAHIKAGEYDKALELYNEPGALPSDWRIIARDVEKAKAIRHRGNSDEIR